MEAFLVGILLGLSITVSIGPGFMALFQTSLSRGLNAGVILATGMLLSDLTLITISYLGMATLFFSGDKHLMGLIAGGILICFGGYSLIKKTSVDLSTPKTNGMQNSITLTLVKGYLVNVANPFSLVFWIGIVGFAINNWGMHSRGLFLFFTGVILMAYSSDLLKCYLSERLRKFLSSKAVGWINKALGIILIGIGIFLIYKVF